MNYRTLANILSTEYGVGPLVASPETVLWAAAKMPRDQAKDELKHLNRARNIYGHIPVFVPYGHPLF